MRIKYKPIIVVVALLALLSFTSKVGAVSSNNPFQATITAKTAFFFLIDLLNHEEKAEYRRCSAST